MSQNETFCGLAQYDRDCDDEPRELRRFAWNAAEDFQGVRGPAGPPAAVSGEAAETVQPVDGIKLLPLRVDPLLSRRDGRRQTDRSGQRRTLSPEPRRALPVAPRLSQFHGLHRIDRVQFRDQH